MTIDILSYELRYKNDRHIMELIRHIQNLDTESKDLRDSEENYSVAVEDLEDEIRALKDTISEANKDLKDILDQLNVLNDLDKDTLVKNINEIMVDIENIRGELR